jgi:methylthioribulose 1-phosphate dehydratase / enolase-phosphatase E1
MRGAGAVIHSHGIETCIATMLNPGAKEFRVNRLVHISVSMSITM